jgi:ribose transport system permease protein
MTAHLPVSPSQGLSRRGSRTRSVLRFVSKFGTLIAMVLLIVYFSFAAPNFAFLSGSNLLQILNQSTLTAIIAGGLTLVLIVGEFDLSIGYTASFTGVLVTGLIGNQGIPIAIAIVVTLLAGSAVGVANGLLVTKAGVNAVVATLGVGTIVVGIEFGYNSGTPVLQLPPAFGDLTLSRFLGVPNSIWIMVVVLVALWLLLNRTPLGQRIQAVGANKTAARLAGIRADRAKISTFVIAGLCAAVTGILLASSLGSGTVSAGDGYLLNAFAAVFLGAATLRDGEFHILGTFIGVILVNIGFNGLSLVGTPTFFQFLFQGGILVIAVALSTIARKYARS